MKHLLGKIGRFFWSRGFLKFILWTTTLLILFYVEEDWRGARAWAATKAEWEAKGESLDFNHFIPPTVPDAQNLGALPIFKLEPYPDDQNKIKSLDAVALREAMRGGVAFSFGNRQKGDQLDIADLEKQVASAYAARFKTASTPPDSLAQLDSLYPCLADLRDAAATMSVCRFPYDDSGVMPASRPLGTMTLQITVAKLFTLHAVLALHQHQAGLAFEDIRTLYRLLSGVEKDPSFVGALVAQGMSAIGDTALREGLALHAWNDAQLSEIQRLLEQPQFLADFQFAFRTEAAASPLNLNYFNQHRWEIDLARWPQGINWPHEKDADFFMRGILRLYPLWPGGWMEHDKSQVVTYELNAIRSVDVKSKRVFPDIAENLDARIVREECEPGAFAPWNFIFINAVSGLAAGPQSLKFARGQVRTDESRIACGLERYRLVHGVYPDSLDVLVPLFITALPHDVMNGEPYHYHLLPGGTFLLYSVGWNQKDDGGQVIHFDEPQKRIDDKHGDWVWPTPQTAPEKSP